MKKQLATLLVLLLSISFISALSINAGSNYSFASEEFDYWDVIGNSSDMEGLDVSWENGNVTLSFDVLYSPDSFTLIFFNNETQIVNEITHYSNSGGGGSSVRYRDRNITQYVKTDCNNTFCDVRDENDTILLGDFEPLLVEELELDKPGFFKRIWNWIKSVFNNDERG